MTAVATKASGPWGRLLSVCRHSESFNKVPTHLASRLSSTLTSHPQFLHSQKPNSVGKYPFPYSRNYSTNAVMGDRVVQELLAEVEREKQLERENKRKAGTEIRDNEEEDDYMGLGPLIEILERKKTKNMENVDQFWEPTDSESDDDERFSSDELKKRVDAFEKKCKRHGELLKNFAEAGLDVMVIDVNRTCKVTKGGQVVKYTALLATGNYHGVVGFAKAKCPNTKIAIQRAYEKCFQNLHYVERYEEHTIAHAIHTKYEKTKI